MGDPVWLLNIGGPSLPSLLLRRGLPDDFSNLQGVVNGNNILSFAPAVSEQQTKDIVLCTLVASRIANAEHPGRLRDINTARGWFNTYLTALEKAGWAPGDSALVTRIDTGEAFRLDEEALAVLRRVMLPGDPGLDNLMSSLAGLESTTNEEELRLFESYSGSGTVASFALGAANVINGVLTMSIGLYYVTGVNEEGRFLFVTWSSTRTDFWGTAKQMSLEEATFSRVRSTIEERAAQSSLNYFASIPLP